MRLIAKRTIVGLLAAAALGYWYSVAQNQQRRWDERFTPLSHMHLIPGHEWYIALRWGLIGCLVGLAIGCVISRRPTVHRARKRSITRETSYVGHKP